MVQSTMVTIRMDVEVKKKSEKAQDPFYSESNLAVLKKSMEQAKEGKVVYKTLEELGEME